MNEISFPIMDFGQTLVHWSGKNGTKTRSMIDKYLFREYFKMKSRSMYKIIWKKNKSNHEYSWL